MKVQQCQFTNQWKDSFTSPGFDNQKVQLILVFGESSLITDQKLFNEIRERFSKGDIVCCSTAGEIIGDEVHDNSIVVTAIQFEKTKIKSKVTNVHQHANSYEAGKYLINELLTDDLNSVFVISDGTYINGSELVTGLNENNRINIPVTGGLAGDGTRFTKTFVGLNDVAGEGAIVAIGFYGNNLKIGHGSFGGWDEFGPEKMITRSEKNILHEIDGKNALDMYGEYLGPFKNELPGYALLFPLSLKEPDSDSYVIRTILGLNEQEKTMQFAGNMPQGSKVRLMKANFEKLIDGSAIAAENSLVSLSGKADLAILISCVGRKLILQKRSDEEVQAAKKIFGDDTPVAGFYSYGEISPLQPFSRCELHNQTMTITTFSES
jgi:hypothetical protein